MAFDFKRHLIKVQGGRSYLPVSARLVWFREEHADWGIETEVVEIDHEKQYAVFRARIYNADGKLMATGTKKEDVKGFGDFIEKAETGAVGRALALCGFGTQFSPELDEVGAGRFSDSPQPMGGNRFGGNSNGGNYGGNGGGARFTPPREASPARPAPIQNAPIRDEDDFEALVGGSDLAAEEDPFSDEGVVAARPTLAPSANGTPACGQCGKALTKAQQELSIRNYGEALCPNCQKDKSRRPALAER